LAAVVQVNVPTQNQYSRVPVDLLPTLKSVLLNVKMPNDFFVALTQYEDDYTVNTIYEIDIGAYQNTKSVIR